MEARKKGCNFMAGGDIFGHLSTWRPLNDPDLVEWILERFLREGSDFRFDKMIGVGPVEAEFDLREAIDMWCTNTSPIEGLVSNNFTAAMTQYPHTELKVMWQREPAGLNLNSISVFFDGEFMRSSGNIDKVLGLVSDVFDRLNCGYGCIHHDDEWMHKDWIDIPLLSGKTGRRSITLSAESGLKDVYWANFFGPLYVELFGRSKVESCPAFRIESIGDLSYMLLTSASPFDWSKPKVLELCERAKRHLDAGAFFDKKHPEKTPVPPLWPDED